MAGSLLTRLRMDREAALTLGKAAVACTTAWILATRVFDARHATFAAFSALMLVEMTVADSVAKAVRYTAAMLAGIGLAGAAVWMWGVQLWLLPLTLALALLIGRWHRLGSQGVNVAVAAIFAYGAFALPSGGGPPGGPLPEIAGMVLLGAAVALAVTLLIAPPLRYRSARYAVDSLSGSLVDLLSEIADGLCGEDTPSADAGRDWRWRADLLPKKGAQARHTVDDAERSTRFNPRRLLVRRQPGVAGERWTIQALERIAGQLQWVAVGLARAVEFTGGPRPGQDEFLRRYGVLLSAVRDAVMELGALPDAEHADAPLAEEGRRCRAALDDLTAHVEGRRLDRPTQWGIYGALYTDAERLCEEVESARDAFAHSGASITTPDGSA
ncbi:hypothetical protein SAMN04489835_1004 [Mycolicibacterium rutilum]|uniref:Aromatic acid exporter family member 1 n=1 Tax=Mycolicibacterium rutilum TaxID=370526 RepID=A0A1H6J0D9_MYCRU|nr:hypothetical protein [Mycolicibacterium rutilum]SEH52877.1 hypothetical protein SAMN04489835_1004 [Mycolicibacterium rutilum]